MRVKSTLADHMIPTMIFEHCISNGTKQMEFAYEVYTEKVYHLIIDAKYFHVTKKSLLWILSLLKIVKKTFMFDSPRIP